MIISIDTEKAFDKIQHPFMIKVLSKLGMRETSWTCFKKSTKNPTGNSILKGKELEVFH